MPSLQPAVKNDRHTGQSITWYAGSTPKVLTGATITGTITDTTTGTSRAITGALSLSDAANGVFTWAYSAADTGTVGVYDVQFTATYADQLSDSSFTISWTVSAKN
jgi:hypothetical protein